MDGRERFFILVKDMGGNDRRGGGDKDVTIVLFFLDIMEFNNEPMRERMENDILFSKMVKAGKRVYYIDVKRDRHNENYLSITESKRVNPYNEEERPVFEKHKIFLYREDMERFMQALHAAVDYTCAHSPAPRSRYYDRFNRERNEGDGVQEGEFAHRDDGYASERDYFSYNGFGQRDAYPQRGREEGFRRTGYGNRPGYDRNHWGMGGDYASDGVKKSTETHGAPASDNAPLSSALPEDLLEMEF